MGRHRGLVVKDASEMVFVGEDFCLEGEECSARIDEIDAREVVFKRNFLGAEVFFNGDRKIGSALDGCIVGDDYALTAVDSSDSGDDTGGGGSVVVHSPGGEW